MKLRRSTYYSTARRRARWPRFRLGVVVVGSRRDRFRRRRNAMLLGVVLVGVGLALLALTHRARAATTRDAPVSALDPATPIPADADDNTVATRRHLPPEHRTRASEVGSPFGKPKNIALLPDTEAIPKALRFKVTLPEGSPLAGDIYCGLFDEAGWPWQPLDFDLHKVEGSEVTCEFRGLRSGRYAIAAFFDKNENRELDRNWLGMPKEPWVLSRNVRPRLPVPPAFSEVSFYFDGTFLVIDAELPG